LETKEQCPICGEGHVTDHVDQIEHEYKGHKTVLPSHYQTCDTCHSDFAGAREGKMSKRGIMAFRKSVDGLLTGTEIVALRKKYKLTQEQAAKLFGGGPVAFSKYENDDVSQSESMDSLLRLVRRSEATFWELVDEKGLSAEFTQDKQVASTTQTAQILVMANYRGGTPRGPDKTTLKPYLHETKKWNS